MYVSSLILYCNKINSTIDLVIDKYGGIELIIKIVHLWKQ